MTNFIHCNNLIEEIPAWLVAEVYGFQGSAEFGALTNSERTIAGVVSAAFGRFLTRIHNAPDSNPEKAKIIDSGISFLEKLARSRETAAREILADEIFESIEIDKTSLLRLLGPACGEAYSAWLCKQAG